MELGFHRPRNAAGFHRHWPRIQNHLRAFPVGQPEHRGCLNLYFVLNIALDRPRELIHNANVFHDVPIELKEKNTIEKEVQ